MKSNTLTLKQEVFYWKLVIEAVIGVNLTVAVLTYIFITWIARASHLEGEWQPIWWLISGILMAYYLAKAYWRLISGIRELRTGALAGKLKRGSYRSIVKKGLLNIIPLIIMQTISWISQEMDIKSLFSAVSFDVYYLVLALYLESYSRRFLSMDQTMMARVRGHA